MRMYLDEIDGNLFSTDNLNTNPYSIVTDIPTEILEDNRSAIDWSKHTVNSTKMKHLERDLKWIQQHVDDNKIKLIYILTKNQIADIFTKPLVFPAFSRLINRSMFTFQY